MKKEITDKELLAICNLSNLRMEFAKIKYKETDTENEVNHTIYSLLEKEVESIEKNNPDLRVFKKEKYKKGIIDYSFSI